MKSILLFLLYMTIGFNGFGQDQDLRIIGSAGATYYANDLQLDWTLGEVMIETLENASSIVSQGFHQPDYIQVPVNPIPDSSGSFQICPDPFDDEFTVKLKLTEFQKGRFGLFDITGKLLWDKNFEGTAWIETFPATSLPAGQYLFIVFLSDDSILYAYPMIKIQ